MKLAGILKKVYILILTCLWSRAINLILCNDMTAKSFIKALQLHCMQYGCPQLLLSDSGSNFVAGSNIILDFIKDKDTQTYFAENGMKSMEFAQYPRGCSELGGIVESCVKLTKRLIYGAIKTNVLDYFDFHFLVQQVAHLLNRRPLTFKESLLDSAINELPSPITAEVLLKGHELVSINLIPELTMDLDEEYVPLGTGKHVEDSFRKLSLCRQNLIELYNSNFLTNLFDQGCNLKNRFIPNNHQQLKIGDIILLREPLLKPSNYPLAVITDLVINDIDEVTAVVCLKGSSRELVRRHVTSIIPYLSRQFNDSPNLENSSVDVSPKGFCNNQRPMRSAAVKCKAKLKEIDF